MKAHTTAAWVLLSLACLQLGTCRAAEEFVGRQAEVLKVLQTTPAWTKAFTASFLTEAARVAGTALGAVSEEDWKAYLEWARTGPAPAYSLSGAMAVSSLEGLDPETYTGKRRIRSEKALCRELLPLIGAWRDVIDAGTDQSAAAKRTAAWSDRQLAAFMAESLNRVGITAAKLKHDQWMLATAPGRRILILLIAAVAQRS